MMTSREAADLLQELIRASHACLDALKIPHLPPPFRSPKTGQLVQRTRPWRTPGGPEGIAFHYTGGMDGIKSLRWFNAPSWGNTESSAHALIFDRPIPELADIWHQHDIAAIFRVPTLIIADITRATWSTNWVNGRCLGIENRNGGTAVYDETALGKPRVTIAGKRWEPYTREQLEANIMLGRIFRAMRGPNFRPEWVVGHSMIWATKADPGPCFPLYQVREAIWSDEPVGSLAWLIRHPLAVAPSGALPEEEHGPEGDGGNVDPPPTQPRWDAIQGPGAPPIAELTTVDTLTPRGAPLWLVNALVRLGWAVSREAPVAELRDFVAYYQRSTLAWAKNHPERVLSVDGVAGPKTRASMMARLAELGV